MKSFEIDQRLVSRAWETVRADNGSPGVDAMSVAAFEARSSGNVYKLWNRMSSGSYFPGPVRVVEVPDDQGRGVRVLGVPNTVDRVAQTAVTMLLEEQLAPILHAEEGRQGRDHEWTIALPIGGLFDRVPHEQLLAAVSGHTSERWVLLYIERWLQAPIRMPDGTLAGREKGSPLGSPISPLLANLYMHDVFDGWMDREHPSCPFERQLDEIVIRCDSEAQAREVLARIVERFETLGLELHPDLATVASAAGAVGPEHPEDVGVRGRLARRLSDNFVDRVPAMSIKAKQAIGQKIRAGYLNRRHTQDSSGPAANIDRAVRGLINNYGRLNRSDLTRWAKKGRKNR